mgnify:CR=1 FL=1
MEQDIAKLVERYLSEDPTKWARLASDIQWRRLQLLLLSEILVELRKLNCEGLKQEET